MPDERFNEISKLGPVQIGVEVTEEMTMSSFDLSEGTSNDVGSGSVERHSSLPSFTTTGKGYQQHRYQSFPSSSAFELESNDSVNATEAPRDFKTFQKTSSIDALFYDETGAPDFREDLTSEVALFNACEHLIGELEVSTFSSRLPKALRHAEKILIEANNLQSFHLLSLPPRLTSSLLRFSSIQNVTTLQTEYHYHRRVRSFDCHLNSPPDGSSFDEMAIDCASEVLEPCQTSLVAGGLVRVIVQESFSRFFLLPLRIRRLQVRLASMSDTDWVAAFPSFPFRLNMEANIRDVFGDHHCASHRLGLPKILSFSSLCEAGSITKSSHINNSGFDPLLSSEAPPLTTVSSQRQLPVGIENFFRNTSTEQKDGAVSPSGNGGPNRLTSKRLIISPIIPKERRKGILLNQQNRCFGCGVFVETRYLRSLRFCEYFGRFFCCVCHANTLMVVPGALLHAWSAAMYPVSKFARDLLVRVHNRPLLHTTDFGPAIRRNPPWSLLDACQLRRQAMAIIPFLRLCPDSSDVLAKVDKLPVHWVTCTDKWSLSDLVSLANSPESSTQSMSGCLRVALESCVAHLSHCLRCRARGHLCEVCHSGRVLFPHFGQADTLVCSDCGACFHRACLAALGTVASRGSMTVTPLGQRDGDPDRRSCPRCIRLRRRREVLIDLCAAPGGWMQVAAKEMPVGSLIIGVDLVPIMPIPNCKSIIADITTDKCRQLLRAALLNNKADVVLHDGAPNVGTAWTVDEYSQAILCLKAFALATEFLRKDGWFITKVFRSRDYEPLKWAVSQFFRKVRVLKPEASRQESAEIFLVGQGYLDPSSIDPKFLDPKHVFGEIEVTKSRESVVSSLLKQTSKRKKAEGYDDKLYKETLLSEFIESDDPLKCLAKTNKVIIDREDLMSHPLTPSFVAECLSDIQVLGKGDIRTLLAWRKKLLAALNAEKEATLSKNEEESKLKVDGVDEDEETQREIERLLKEEQKTAKKRLKTVRKAKRKLAERIVLKMEHAGDIIEQNSAGELFSLASIGGRDFESLENMEKALIEKTGHSAADLLVLKEEKDAKREILRRREEDFRRAVEGGDYLRFERNAEHEIDLGALESTQPTNTHECDDIYLSSGDDDNGGKDGMNEDECEVVLSSDSDEREGPESCEESEGEDEYAKALAKEVSIKRKKGGTSLLTDLDAADEGNKRDRKIEAWCTSTEVKELMDVDESGSDEEEWKEPKTKKQKLSPSPKKRVTFADDVVCSSPRKQKVEEAVDGSGGNELSSDTSTTDGEAETRPRSGKKRKLRRLRRPLTVEEKALATQLIQSAKSRRDLLEWNFHRYRFFDEEANLPDWFVNEEKKHMRKALPLELKDLTARPIQGKTLKKAEEAKARKRMKMAKRLARVRKRAENLPDDLTEKEAWSKVRTMYKNAGLLKKKRRPIAYVVNTKAGARSRSQSVPRGAKIKLVDRRMKSDLRGRAGVAAKRGRKTKSRRGH
ncbi:pre-rRNA 2'-O-ribose RNA methyltransferase FTSJ3 [Taenia crassiceps]|uniref:Pre-rRNA 2'-O-ribose RNA methyltransferase FTSJ3 n=1 Tax=Taenia crassiceps TaxID=6207 RepID=A0ABR4QI78_9CEST